MARKRFCLGLAVLALILGLTLFGCGGSGGTGNGELIEYQISTGGSIHIKFSNIYYASITYMGSANEGWEPLYDDFLVTLDGEKAGVIGAGGNGGEIILKTGKTYSNGDKVRVKVVYTANPSRKLETKGSKYEDVVVQGFDIDEELTADINLGN